MEPTLARKVLRANGFTCGRARKDGSWTAKSTVAVLSQARSFDVTLDVELEEATEKYVGQITAKEGGRVSQGQKGDLDYVVEVVLGFVAKAAAM